MILFGCVHCGSPEAPEGFDNRLWRTDPMGCQNKRTAQLDDFLKIIKPHLLNHALREPQVRDLLGKADAIEIAERGMKFYKYYVEAGRQCPDKSNTRKGRYIQIRFDALNRVNEVALITPNA